jgi:diguanylate cyclase (GGDEF)-like protein
MVKVTWAPFEESIKRHVFAENHETASRISDNISRMFSEQFNLLGVISENAEIRSMDEKRQDEVLASMARNIHEVQLAVLSNAKGQQIARWDKKPHDQTINYLDRAYFHQVMNTGKIAVSDVIRAKSTGLLGVVVAAPIRDDGGAITAVLIVNIELQKLIDKIRTTKIGKSGYLYVVNSKKEIIIHPTKGLLEHPIAASTVLPVIEVSKGKSGSMEYYGEDGRHLLASYFPVDAVDWGVIVEQPYGEALAEIDAIKKKDIAVIISLVFLAAGIGVFIAGVFLRPIRGMTEASRALAEGDMSVRLSGTYRGELGHLAKSFNHMADFMAIRQEELEAMVSCRTQELRQLNEELKRIATSDGLTGLANRRYLDDYLQVEWHRAMREGNPLSVLMIDADFFKSYNDTFGHLQGDEALKTIAEAIRISLLHSSDLAARYGGEEFMVVLPDTDEEGALTVADRLMGTIRNANISHPASAISDRITVSIGIASVNPTQELTLEDTINKADQCLYLAKQKGRNRIVSIDQETCP